MKLKPLHNAHLVVSGLPDARAKPGSAVNLVIAFMLGLLVGSVGVTLLYASFA